VAAKLLFELIGEATSAVAAFKKTTDASKTAAGAAQSTGSTFAKVAGAIATGYAVKKVVDFGKSTVEAAGAAAKANKLVTATFKNAGDASGEAAKHAIELADSLGRQIGVSPDVIKGAEGILATFHSVSGAAGMQAGIFDRATKAAADLAAAGYGDMKSNAVQLGKALEDPTKGLTALTRSGVNFTAAQKEQIKNMQKSGNVLGAQKIILAEVENQVKGTAAATAGSGAKMSVAYEEMKVKLGTGLLPVVGQFKTMLAGLFDFVAANASWLVPLATAVLGFAVALVTVSKAVNMTKTAIEGAKLAINGMKLAWTLLNTSFLASPIGLIIVGVVALAAALVLLYLKVDWFRAAVDKAFSFVLAIIQAVWRWVIGNWPILLAVLTGPIGIAVAIIVRYWDVIKGAAFAVLGWLRGNWPVILAILTGPVGVAVLVISRYWSQITSAAAGAASSVGRFFAGVYNAIVGPFASAIGWIRGVPGMIAGALGGVVGAVAGAVSGVFNALIAPFQRGYSWVQSNVLAPLRGAWNSFANTINSVSISTPAVSIAGHDVIPAFHWTPPWHIPTLAQGGLLTRSGLVYAHAGEVISPAPAAARGPLVAIAQATFNEPVDVDTFGQRLRWQLATSGV
jgi:phage-related protein